MRICTYVVYKIPELFGFQKSKTCILYISRSYFQIFHVFLSRIKCISKINKKLYNKKRLKYLDLLEKQHFCTCVVLNLYLCRSKCIFVVQNSTFVVITCTNVVHQFSNFFYYKDLQPYNIRILLI